eukprot:s617_g27.t1
MVYTEMLPKCIDPELWQTGNWDVQRCTEHARSWRSNDRCRARTNAPPREAKALLSQLRESDAMWLGLRRHLEVRDAIFVLRVLSEHSGGREIKRSDDERNRKAYLRLCDECSHYSPGWEHTAMKERQRAARAKAKAATDAAAAESADAAASEGEEF